MDEARAQTGDTFHQQVLSHVGLIRHVGRRSLYREHDLDDFTQTVLVAAYAGRDQLRRANRIGPWIAGIARNVARDWNRRRAPVFTADPPDVPSPAPRADEALEDIERWERVVDALSTLSVSEQELLRSHYLEGRGPEELQEELGLSHGAVRVRLTRARQSLRRRLGVVSGLMAWFAARPKARAFGEVPVGSGRMSTAFSLMTSTLIVGWLGLGAHQIEQATVNLAMLPVQDGAPMRIVPVHQLVADSPPPAPPSASVSVGEGQNMSKILDVGPSHIYSTVVGALHRVMQGAGRPEWSHERLQGVLGHAFGFVMRKGNGAVWQEAFVDYGDQATFLDMLPELGYRFQRFEATGTDEDLKAVRAEAWAAVRASIDRGVPAMAASPMSLEQEADGLRAQIWGLLVGYDEADETYTVRHQYVTQGTEAFAVRYDALGQIDQWFCVLVCDTTEPVDIPDVHIRALQNAVALANGTRYGPDDIAYRVDTTGFDAYELWREGIGADVATPERAQRHAWELHVAREHAIGHLRELVDVYPTAADALEDAITAYGREVETTQEVQEVCEEAKDAGEFSAEARAQVQELISASLAADRDAIACVEAAIVVLHASP